MGHKGLWLLDQCLRPLPRRSASPSRRFGLLEHRSDFAPLRDATEITPTDCYGTTKV
jgi:hypothetical protein